MAAVSKTRDLMFGPIIRDDAKGEIPQWVEDLFKDALKRDGKGYKPEAEFINPDGTVDVIAFQKWVKHGWHTNYKPVVRFTKRCDYLMATGFGGETGEALEVLKKAVRDNWSKKKVRAELTSELGDVLYYLTIIAERHGITLKEIMLENHKKLVSRRAKKKKKKLYKK